MTDRLREAAQQAPMAYYALVIKADSGYESTTEGRCTADQYGAAMAALHGTAALAQQDAQAVPSGYKLVPVEPTPEMVRAAYTHGGGVEADWQAMLNAAPTPSAQQDAQAVPQGDKGTPGAWFVRKLVRDGELKDCFVAAPSFDGMPYDAEILGDDEYRDGVERKLADCELIVAAVNALRAAPTPPAQRVMLTPEEITEVIVDCYGYSADIEFHECLARAVIEAYERKNGIK